MQIATQQTLRDIIRIAFFASLAAVLVLALSPRPPVLPLAGSDKSQHFLAFFALSGLAGLAWPSSIRQSGLGLLFLGAIIEVLQGTSIIGRDMSSLDWTADAIGVSVGLVFAIASARLLPLFNRSDQN
jgi:VanZ family protein